MFKVVVLVGLAVLLAGCSGPEVATTPSSSASPVPASTTKTSATPVAKDVTVYLPTYDEVKGAGLAVQTQPVVYTIGPHTPFHLVNACGGLPSDPLAQWAAQGISYIPGGGKGNVHQLVGEYAGLTGADVVASVKQAISCRTVTIQDEQYSIVGDFSVPGLADPQAGFCASLRTHSLVHCVLVLGHANRATSITFAGAWNDNLKAVKAFATRTAPLYVPAFERD
ncbi:hypothetical protein [Amycolatopsis sp. NPDC051102]|uniref:hypothetical protein n=1 Tax=Amycolatopsis sp. NPDC051102 TaxID=3155163 RepID=UPI0034435841